MKNNQTKTVYRAVYKRELPQYLTGNLQKEEYSLENCLNNYSGKNNIDYKEIAQNFSNPNEGTYFLHFFDNYKSAHQYEIALKNGSILKEDTAIIACQFPTDVLNACKGFGIYEKSSGSYIVDSLQQQNQSSSESSVFTEFAIPLSQYSPDENLLGQAKSPTEIVPIEQDSSQQVFYDPDSYSSFF